jgi:hypothetical protein
MTRMLHIPLTFQSRPKWLFPWLLVGLVVLIIGIGLFAFRILRPPYTPEVTGRPRGVLSQDFFDYGDVKQGEWITTSFTVKNVGDQPLEFPTDPYVELIEGCCPPIASITSRTLYPGEEATVSMSFMMDLGMTGPHEYLAHIMTNDPQNPDLQVRILSNWVE